MDSLPPNDPNRNNNSKEQPFDGRRSQRNRNSNGQQQQQEETMDVLGNMEDSPMVVVMFLVGVAAWFLRTRCVC